MAQSTSDDIVIGDAAVQHPVPQKLVRQRMKELCRVGITKAEARKTMIGEGYKKARVSQVLKDILPPRIHIV